MLAAATLVATAHAADLPPVHEADFTLHDFRFHTGETLPELRMHYRTIGSPSGEPVLILHGTAHSGAAMLAQPCCRDLGCGRSYPSPGC